MSTGPVFASVAAGSKPGTLVVSYTPGSAVGLHTAPTADCDKIGSKLCCGESPFQVRAAAATTHSHLPRPLRFSLSQMRVRCQPDPAPLSCFDCCAIVVVWASRCKSRARRSTCGQISPSWGRQLSLGRWTSAPLRSRRRFSTRGSSGRSARYVVAPLDIYVSPQALSTSPYCRTYLD